MMRDILMAVLGTLVLGAVGLSMLIPNTPSPDYDCYTDGAITCTTVIEYGQVPDETWEGLKAAGWHSDPNDGKEALYSTNAGQ